MQWMAPAVSTLVFVASGAAAKLARSLRKLTRHTTRNERAAIAEGAVQNVGKLLMFNFFYRPDT